MGGLGAILLPEEGFSLLQGGGFCYCGLKNLFATSGRVWRNYVILLRRAWKRIALQVG